MKAPAFWSLPHPNAVAQALRPMSFAYAALAALHGAWRALNPYYAAVPVISVGNITAGGAGKTPVTRWLAEAFSRGGHQIAIVSRGYGGTETAQPTEVNPVAHTAAQVGDEPLELARHFAGKPVSVWVCRHRPSAVKRAEQAGAALILLDDGFQRRDIARTVDILVINGATALGNGLPLPAGPLRESISALKRASFAIVIDEPPSKRNTWYGLDAYRLTLTPTAESLARLQGKPLMAFAGLAYPQKFFATLKAHGLNVQEEHPYPDHHAYTKSDLAFLKSRARMLGATLVTTAKDAAKLPQNFCPVLETTLTGEDAENILNELALRLR